MKLRDLDGQLVRFEAGSEDRGYAYHFVDTLAEADGVTFLCPHCFEKNHGEVGTHSVLVWFSGRPNVPTSIRPLPRWEASGTSVDDLTISPSIDLGNGDWHGWVQNGEAR